MLVLCYEFDAKVTAHASENLTKIGNRRCSVDETELERLLRAQSLRKDSAVANGNWRSLAVHKFSQTFDNSAQARSAMRTP
jgi:hypothetical protein